MSSKLRFVTVLAICCLIMIRLAQPVKAAATVSDCNDYYGLNGLYYALQSGGLITFTCSGTIIVPEITINFSTTLDATGQNVILDGNNANRIFWTIVPLTLEHITLRNGYAAPSAGGHGAALVSGAEARINNSTIISNNGVVGGAIINGNFGKMVITNSTISGNSAVNGGAIFNLGDLTIEGSTFSGNKASQNGGVIYNNFHGKFSIRQSTLSGNSALTSGSALFKSSDAGVSNIECSNITGNAGGATYSVANQGGTLAFTARKNWWGDASGPGGVGPGAGDPVSTLIDFADFLVAPATITDCPIPVIPTATPVVTQPSTEVPAPSVAETMPLCADLDGTTNPVVRVSLPLGIYGVHCRIIAENRVFTRTPAEVGVPSVLDRGVIHAVDIFSPSNASAAGVLLCLQGEGDLIFLDAAGAPRVPEPLPIQPQDGFSCAVIPNVGTLVLVQK